MNFPICRAIRLALFGHDLAGWLRVIRQFPSNFFVDNCRIQRQHTPSALRRAPALSKQVDLLPGTLDLLILKAVSLGPQHGYGVLLRIEQISGGALSIEQGALYPALYRLERRGLLKTAWGVSDTNRKAKFYQLTAAGIECLQEETAGWNRLVSAMRLALKAEFAKG